MLNSLLYLEIFYNLEAFCKKSSRKCKRTKTVTCGKGLTSSVGGFQRWPVVKGRVILYCCTNAIKRSLCDQSCFVNYFMEMRYSESLHTKTCPLAF